jgi:septum formation protein
MRIILASASPRRAKLLALLVKNFSVEPSDILEGSIYKRARAAVDIAVKKARAAQKSAKSGEQTLIVAADTAVWLGKRQCGKPADKEDAKDMLLALSGRRHTVYTGVCVIFGGSEYKFYEKSAVKFKKLDQSAAEAYIEKYNPLDKAGAYGVQDNELVKGYLGSYTNIMGLPLERLESLFKKIEKKHGVKILDEKQRRGFRPLD